MKTIEVLHIEVEKNIPMPATRRTGLSDLLRKLELLGDSLLLPPGVKKSSIYPTAKSLGFKVKIREEFGETEVKKWSNLTKSMALQRELLGIRVWRVS